MHIKILLLLLIVYQVKNDENEIIIGGIFEEGSNGIVAFQYAVDYINSKKEHNFVLKPQMKIIQAKNSFEALTAGCQLLEEKVLMIIGPRDIDNINSVQSLSDNKEIPHIITQYNYKSLHNHNIVNLYPFGSTLTKAYLDIINELEWKSFTILYEDNESLLRMAELIKITKEKNFVVTLKQINELNNNHYRKALKKARVSGETNFVLDCKIENLHEILLQAQQVGLITHHYNFLLTNLDLHTINLTPFQYSGAMITGIRLSNTENNEMIEPKKLNGVELAHIDTETVLMIDGISMFVQAFEQMPKILFLGLKDLNCNSSKSFVYGSSLINIIKGGQYNGLSGLIEFDLNGFRSSFELDFNELTEDKLVKKGTWDFKSGLTIIPIQEDFADDDPESLRNKTFIIETCLTEPYGMLKETDKPLTGNDQFEGFGIDLIDELAKMEGFKYKFIIRHDKMNGAKHPVTGKWSGMIGDLIDHRADLAITDLTITSGRAEAVDFTARFMDLGISILAQKPGKAPPSFFSFADPFGFNVWLMLALAYSIVSLSLFIMGRISSEEWTNPYPCIEEPEYLVNQFTLKNSAWFACGSLMQQGTEIAPIAISTRMIAGMWWFFVLIMVSSYTANLAAFLATENPKYIFEDIKTLVQAAEADKIRFGAKFGGATASFFSDSDNELYKQVAKYMENHPNDMPKENKDGVVLAENTNYAFFMESTSIEYETQRHCGLQQYGDLLDDKGYGIAMRKNSTYRKRLTTAVLRLRESGVIADIKRKWWQEQRGGGQCDVVESDAAATPLGLKNVEGVFYVTVGGLICSIFSVLIEMLIYTIQISIKQHLPFKEVVKAEIKAYLNFDSNVKPVPKSPSRSKSKSLTKSKSKSQEILQSDSKSENSNNEQLLLDPYGFKASVFKEEVNDEEM